MTELEAIKSGQALVLQTGVTDVPTWIHVEYDDPAPRCARNGDVYVMSSDRWGWKLVGCGPNEWLEDYGATILAWAPVPEVTT